MTFQYLNKVKKAVPLEVLFWIAGLTALAITDPENTHFTICVFKNLGINFCPGCGIGRAISYIFHGQLSKSFETHILGIPALLVLVHRIITLIKSNYKPSNKN